jgi:hypothetical protein
VAKGNVDVGAKTPSHKSGAATAKRSNDASSNLRPGQQNLVKAERLRDCRVMLQQCADSGRGHQSAPQKFVQLVGCRESSATRPNPQKR